MTKIYDNHLKLRSTTTILIQYNWLTSLCVQAANIFNRIVLYSLLEEYFYSVNLHNKIKNRYQWNIFYQKKKKKEFMHDRLH